MRLHGFESLRYAAGNSFKRQAPARVRPAAVRAVAFRTNDKAAL